MNELQLAQDEALLLYIDGTLTDKKISDHLNIDPNLLKSWIKDGDWEKKRDEADADIIARSNTRFKKHIAKRRLETAERHLRIATMIEDQISDRIKQSKDPTGTSQLAGIPISTRELKDMSQALKNSADTSARAVVLTERESDFTGGNFNGGNDGVKRLINVNIMPLGPASSQSPGVAIDVTSETEVKKLKPVDADPF